MRIAIAADHAGFSLKQELAAWLRSSGYDVTDLGTNSTEPVDYPDMQSNLAITSDSGIPESHGGNLVNSAADSQQAA